MKNKQPISQQLQEFYSKHLQFSLIYYEQEKMFKSLIQQVKELENDKISLQQQLSEQAEYTFDYQLRILKSCGYTNINEDIIFSHKYFMEMLVRPNFGDSDPHYEKLIQVFDYLEKHRLLKQKSDAENSVKLEEFKKAIMRGSTFEIKDEKGEYDKVCYRDQVLLLADKYFGGKE